MCQEAKQSFHEHAREGKMPQAKNIGYCEEKEEENT